jgi:hypothetical protein
MKKETEKTKDFKGKIFPNWPIIFIPYFILLLIYILYLW